MKKYFIGAAALLAFTACSNDETVDLNQDGNVISFAVTANNPSRVSNQDGQGVYCNNNKPTEFTVYATVGGASYIDGDLIKLSSGKYVNQEATRYWPSGDVTFYALQNATMDWTTPATPKVTSFTVASDVSQQKDFVYARKTQNKSTNSQVNLNFRHALSQIVFEAINKNGHLDVVIDEVKIVNVAGTGTFTFPGTDTDDNVVDHDQTGSTSPTTQGTWVLGDKDQTFAVSVPVGNQAVRGNSTKVELTSTKVSGKEYSANAMLLLPHSGAATTAWVPSTTHPKPTSSGQTGSYFLVKCSIRNVNAGTGTASAGDVYLWGDGTGTKYVAIPYAFAWEQGKKYTYTFTFDKGNGGYNPETPGTDPEPVLVPITIDITVDDFVKGADTDIPMQTN